VYLCVERYPSNVSSSDQKSNVGWNEAIASNHLKLVLLPDPEGEPPGCPDDNQEALPSTKLESCGILGSADKHSMASFESIAPVKSKIRPKPEKVKYIPKQRGTSSN